MSSYDDRRQPGRHARPAAGPGTGEVPRPGWAPVVWGLIVVALAALIIISQLGIVALNGTYVLIGLMIGAGAALVSAGCSRPADVTISQRQGSLEPWINSSAPSGASA